MDNPMATDEITDSIASIEMHWQEAQKDAGSAAACAAALHNLQELLDREQEALRLHGPGTEHTDHPANIAALTIAIGKVRGLAGSSNRHSLPKGAPRGKPEMPRQFASHHPDRNRGRRTMGRSGGH